MQWEIQLSGPSEDLKALGDSMSSGNIRIFSRNDQFFLEWIGFEPLGSADDVRASAKNLLQMLTGAARLALGMRKPIEVAHIARNRPDGKRELFSYVEEAAFVRDFATISVTAPDESRVVIRPADPIPKWIDLAGNDAPVAKALRLIGRGADDWVSLYRLFEVIVNDEGGIPVVASLGWASKTMLENFKHTANSPLAIGDDARHGTTSKSPPKMPMEFAGAKALVNILLHEWLRKKMPER